MKKICEKRVILGSALFLAFNLSAMDPELQVLVDGGAVGQISVEQGGDSQALYALIGEHNRKFLAEHDTKHLLRVFDQLKLEQHLSLMALKQFEFAQNSQTQQGDGVLMRGRRHHARPRATQHSHTTQHSHATQHVTPAQRTHSKSALDRQLDRQNNNACEQEEKEREQDLAELAKGKERAQAELTTVLLSVLSQQLKERADQLAKEKEKSDEDHQQEVAKKDKCQKCLTATTTVVGILGALATAWAAVMTASCAGNNGGK